MMFSVSKDVNFESFGSIKGSSEKIPHPDISADIPNMDSLSLSVDEIYDAIVAILNKVILTEDDLFILMQLIGEGGLQLVGFMPQNMLQEIMSSIEESIKDMVNLTSSPETILVLLAQIQQFSNSDLGQLIDMPRFDESLINQAKPTASEHFPQTHLPIHTLYDTDNISSEVIKDTTIREEPDNVDEQLAGAMSYQNKANLNIESNTDLPDILPPEKVSSIKQLGNYYKTIKSKQDQLVSKTLDTLLKIIHQEVESILDKSLGALENTSNDLDNGFFSSNLALH